ncbi:hypothetical protein FQN50_008325 [Emmonsiellopsis sp. PD_5]|nr:hypothetical protein FQN50_008325 [Emmonsiellopsis sp. PD_5]
MHSMNDFFTPETSIGTKNYGYQTHHHGHGCPFEQSAISGPSGSSDPNMNQPLDLCPTLDDCNHQSHFGPVFSDCNPDEFLGFIPMESYPQFHNRYAQLDGILKLPCDILPDHIHKDPSQISHHSSRPTSSGLDSVHPKSSPFSSPPPKDVTSALTSPELGPIGELHICKCRLRNKPESTICGASFSDAGQLQDHLIQNHVGTMEGSQGHGYYCSWEGCHRPDEPFSQKSKLQGHFLTHSNHKGFQCSVCRKPFARQATLERHERSHRGEKPYTCKMCQKSFTDSSELKTHMRTHTGEKPFKCNHPGCNFETGDSSNMSSHRLTHGVRKHKCHFPGCTKSFTRPDQLKRHLKTTHKEGTLSPGPLSSPSVEQFPLPQFEPPYRRPSLVGPYQDTAMMLTTN